MEDAERREVGDVPAGDHRPVAALSFPIHSPTPRLPARRERAREFPTQPRARDGAARDGNLRPVVVGAPDLAVDVPPTPRRPVGFRHQDVPVSDGHARRRSRPHHVRRVARVHAVDHDLEIAPTRHRRIRDENGAGLFSPGGEGRRAGEHDRGHAVPPSPNLTLLVAAPTSHRGIRQERARVRLAERDVGRGRYAGHRHRRGRVVDAFTQLTFVIPPPTSNRTVGEDTAGVVVPRRHARGGGNAGDGDREGRVRGGEPVPELAVLVIPPAPDNTCREHRAGV